MKLTKTFIVVSIALLILLSVPVFSVDDASSDLRQEVLNNLLKNSSLTEKYEDNYYHVDLESGSLFDSAMYALVTDQPDSALTYFTRLIDEYLIVNDTVIGEIYYFMAQAYFGKNELEPAYDMLKIALEKNYRTSDLYSNITMLLNDQGEFEKALIHSDTSIALDPNSDKAWNNRAISYLQLDSLEQAIECFKKAHDLNPQNIEATFNLAVSYQYSGDVRAIEYLKKILEIDNTLGFVWSQLSLAYYEQFDTVQCNIVLDSAILYCVNEQKPWDLKAVVLSQLGRYEEALESLDSALVYNPKSPEIWYNRGIIYFKTGNFLACRYACDTVLMLMPNYYEARKLRNESLNNMGIGW